MTDTEKLKRYYMTPPDHVRPTDVVLASEADALIASLRKSLDESGAAYGRDVTSALAERNAAYAERDALRSALLAAEQERDVAINERNEYYERALAAEERVKEMEQNDARYRWLRNEGSHMGIIEWRALNADYQNLEQFDSAIDSHLAALESGEGK